MCTGLSRGPLRARLRAIRGDEDSLGVVRRIHLSRSFRNLQGLSRELGKGNVHPRTNLVYLKTLGSRGTHTSFVSNFLTPNKIRTIGDNSMCGPRSTRTFVRGAGYERCFVYKSGRLCSDVTMPLVGRLGRAFPSTRVCLTNLPRREGGSRCRGTNVNKCVRMGDSYCRALLGVLGRVRTTDGNRWA